ncbi:MAG TPA: hypothetical protein VFI78_07550 [Salinimicrobium sp.]|nr:hypothetical protein [Salinimicrobium sp.]
MKVLKIEIQNPKAMQLLEGMQDLNLIQIKNEPVSRLKTYLNKMRKKSGKAPDLDEIGRLVEEVRSERYAKK